jgi:hypothetical protein
MCHVWQGAVAHFCLLQLQGELRVENVASGDDQSFNVHCIKRVLLVVVFWYVSQEGHVTGVRQDGGRARAEEERRFYHADSTEMRLVRDIDGGWWWRRVVGDGWC